MIKVQWNDFARRRNLKLENFVNSMSYIEYTRWCEYRSVIPVPETQYKIQIISPSIPVKEKFYTQKELTKMLKTDLIDYALELGISLDGSETKKQITDLILDLNKNV